MPSPRRRNPAPVATSRRGAPSPDRCGVRAGSVPNQSSHDGCEAKSCPQLVWMNRLSSAAAIEHAAPQGRAAHSGSTSSRNSGTVCELGILRGCRSRCAGRSRRRRNRQDRSRRAGRCAWRLPAAKSAKAGMNQHSASDGMTLTTSLARLLPASTRWVSAAMSSSAGVIPAKMAWPASVSTMRLLSRVNSFRPRKSSRCRTCWLTAAGRHVQVRQQPSHSFRFGPQTSNDFNALRGGSCSMASTSELDFLSQTNIFPGCGKPPPLRSLGWASGRHAMRHILDLDRYPLDRPGTPAWQALVDTLPRRSGARRHVQPRGLREARGAGQGDRRNPPGDGHALLHPPPPPQHLFPEGHSRASRPIIRRSRSARR